MATASFKVDWKSLRASAGPFPPEAFAFVRDGLAHAVKVTHGERLNPEQDCHVSGAELCFGLKDYAIQRYGLLARTVLERWGVRETADFGRIVFAMVDAGLMRKTDEDRIEDFEDVYTFSEAFDGVEV